MSSCVVSCTTKLPAVRPLGVTAFGQTGDLVDLYRAYGLDTDAIVRACVA